MSIANWRTLKAAGQAARYFDAGHSKIHRFGWVAPMYEAIALLGQGTPHREISEILGYDFTYITFIWW